MESNKIGLYSLLILSVSIGIYLISLALNSNPQKPITKDECYRLGSNERMNRCLLEFEQNVDDENVLDAIPEDQFEYIIVNTAESTIDNNTISLSIKNITSYDLSSVTYKVKFYKSEPASCYLGSDDTKYVKLYGYILKGDTRVISGIIEPPSFDGQFWWCLEPILAIGSYSFD